MATTSVSKIKVTLSQDVTYGQEFTSASNTNSRGINTLETLASGNNLITVSTTQDVAVVIIPPVSNTVAITAKGTNADVGILISKTQPTLLAVGSTTSFVLSAAAEIVGVRILKI